MFRDKRIETLHLTVAVCCGNVSNLIGRRTINIPEIIFGVHAFSVSTVNIYKNGAVIMISALH